jgi:hypothetical protein
VTTCISRPAFSESLFAGLPFDITLGAGAGESLVASSDKKFSKTNKANMKMVIGYKKKLVEYDEFLKKEKEAESAGDYSLGLLDSNGRVISEWEQLRFALKSEAETELVVIGSEEGVSYSGDDWREMTAKKAAPKEEPPWEESLEAKEEAEVGKANITSTSRPSSAADPASFSKNVIVKGHRCASGVAPLATFSRPLKPIIASQQEAGQTVAATSGVPRADRKDVRGVPRADPPPNSKAVEIETTMGGSRFCRPVQLIGDTSLLTGALCRIAELEKKVAEYEKVKEGAKQSENAKAEAEEQKKQMAVEREKRKNRKKAAVDLTYGYYLIMALEDNGKETGQRSDFPLNEIILTEIKDSMNVRNNSLFAHGYNMISKEE